MKKLILASTSPFRKEILKKLDLSFKAIPPDCDETAFPGESHKTLVMRLSEAKARSLANREPNALIIGSDQVADLENEMLTKPHTHDVAIEQLKKCSGQTVVFHTGLCLLDTEKNICQVDSVVSAVKFRELTELQIERYLIREQPYHCAGSFKSEGLGITLFEQLIGDDPNALIGLPMIRLCDMFAKVGVSLP